MKKALLTLVASTLFFVPALFAQNRPNAVHKDHAKTQESKDQAMVNRHVERLAVLFNLTPDQKKQTTTYFSKAWDDNRQVMMQMRQDRKTLDNDINAKADQSKLAADDNALGQDHAKIIANNADAQAQFLSVLTPQEQTKYQKLQASRFGGRDFGHAAPGAIAR